MVLIVIAVIVVIVLAVALGARVRTAIGMRRGDQVVINRKRTGNKRRNNRLVMSIARAGKSHSIFALVHHVGRRSGKSFMTPVRALPVENGFVIPLTYGRIADWYRNLAAAGGGQIEWHGKLYRVGAPSIVAAATVLHLYPLPSRFLFWLDGVLQFVRVPIMK